MDKGWKLSAPLPHRPRAGEKEIEGRRGTKCCSPEREGEGHGVAGAQSETVAAGDGGSPGGSAQHRKLRAQRKRGLWFGLGLEVVF
jgi:hypothetical protein